jgi:hypothetical protein
MPTRLLINIILQCYILLIQLLEIQWKFLLVLFQLLVKSLRQIVVEVKINILGNVISEDLLLDFLDKGNEFFVGVFILGIKFSKGHNDVFTFELVVVVDAFSYLEEDFDPSV